MSISSEVPRRVELVAIADQTVFFFTSVLIMQATDIDVYLNGVQLNEGPDYSVALAGTPPSDGSVTLNGGANAGDIVVIEAQALLIQPTVYNPGTAFPADSHEAALDRQTILSSDLAQRLRRAPQFDAVNQVVAATPNHNLNWLMQDFPSLTDTKVPMFDPVTKNVVWGDPTVVPGTVDFAAITGTLDISGADARILDLTKPFVGAIPRDLIDILSDFKVVTDFGATGDGATDDTSALQAALDTAGMIVFPPGNYLISGLLTLSANTCLKGAGVGVTRLFSNTDHTFFSFEDVGNICIEGFTVEGIHPGGTGNNTTFDGVNGLNLLGVQRNFWICNNEFKNITGRAIVLSNDHEDVFIKNNRIENALIGIFHFKGQKGAVIEGNVIRDCRVSGIFLDDATTGDTVLTAKQPLWHSISHNVILGTGFDPVNTGTGIGVSAVIGVVIQGNVIDDLGDPGVNVAIGILANTGQDDLFTTERLVIDGNTVSNCSGSGYFIQAAFTTVLSNNVAQDNNQWNVALPSAAEIVVRSEPSTLRPANTVIVDGNAVANTGAGMTESVFGIDIQDVNVTQIHIGANVIDNLTSYRMLADAGDVNWRSVETISTVPAHVAGFRGRLLYDDAQNAWIYSDGAAFTPVGPTAWCTFDGTLADPIAITAGRNVTNVTKNATGDYTVNFSVTLNNANFAISGSARTQVFNSGGRTSNTVQVQSRDAATGALTDSSYISVLVMGT